MNTWHSELRIPKAVPNTCQDFVCTVLYYTIYAIYRYCTGTRMHVLIASELHNLIEIASSLRRVRCWTPRNETRNETTKLHKHRIRQIARGCVANKTPFVANSKLQTGKWQTVCCGQRSDSQVMCCHVRTILMLL